MGKTPRLSPSQFTKVISTLSSLLHSLSPSPSTSSKGDTPREEGKGGINATIDRLRREYKGLCQCIGAYNSDYCFAVDFATEHFEAFLKRMEEGGGEGEEGRENLKRKPLKGKYGTLKKGGASLLPPPPSPPPSVQGGEGGQEEGEGGREKGELEKLGEVVLDDLEMLRSMTSKRKKKEGEEGGVEKDQEGRWGERLKGFRKKNEERRSAVWEIIETETNYLNQLIEFKVRRGVIRGRKEMFTHILFYFILDKTDTLPRPSETFPGLPSARTTSTTTTTHHPPRV